MTSAPKLRVGDLGRLEHRGDGGQGKVFRTEGRPGELFKRYHDPQKVRLPALQRLSDFADQLSEEDRHWLTRRTAMPTTLVYENGACVGFLMPEAGPQFLGPVGKTLKLRELQFLTFPPRPGWGALDVLTMERRLVWLQQVTRLFSFLHRQELVVGDVSMRNLLWSNEEDPGLFLLDCDGMRFTGEEPAVPVVETPDWNDPSLNGGPPTIDSDRYKLALVIHRTLTIQPKVRPEAPPADPDPLVPESVWRLLSSVHSDGSTARPTAEAWLEAVEGRGRITLAPIKQRPPRVGRITPAVRPALNMKKRP